MHDKHLCVQALKNRSQSTGVNCSDASLIFIGMITVGTQRAYFELKYFKIVKMRDAKYSLKMAAEKWRQKFPF